MLAALIRVISEMVFILNSARLLARGRWRDSSEREAEPGGGGGTRHGGIGTTLQRHLATVHQSSWLARLIVQCVDLACRFWAPQ